MTIDRTAALNADHTLGYDACAAFLRDGVIAPVDVMPKTEAAQVRARIEAIEARSHGRLSGLARTKPHLLVPALWDIVFDPRIVDAVGSLLGPDILCIGSSIIDKPAGSKGYVAWHQDATFWGLSESVGATAWLALTPATPQSGCMEVLPATHGRQLDHLDTEDARNMLGAREAVRDHVDLSMARQLVLQPGQMSLHHPLVLHGSRPNTSAERRLGFVIRYVPARVRQEGATATLVRGLNLSAMPLEQPPEAEMDAAALARHPDIVRRGAAVIRQGKASHLAVTRSAREAQS